jgi:hypothetical protein
VSFKVGDKVIIGKFFAGGQFAGDIAEVYAVDAAIDQVCVHNLTQVGYSHKGKSSYFTLAASQEPIVNAQKLNSDFAAIKAVFGEVPVSEPLCRCPNYHAHEVACAWIAYKRAGGICK